MEQIIKHTNHLYKYIELPNDEYSLIYLVKKHYLRGKTDNKVT